RASPPRGVENVDAKRGHDEVDGRCEVLCFVMAGRRCLVRHGRASSRPSTISTRCAKQYVGARGNAGMTRKTNREETRRSPLFTFQTAEDVTPRSRGTDRARVLQEALSLE